MIPAGTGTFLKSGRTGIPVHPYSWVFRGISRTVFQVFRDRWREERLKHLFMIRRSPVIYKADHKLTPINERDKIGFSRLELNLNLYKSHQI